MADYSLLAKILLYEVQKGYNDSAVINGLSAFVANWQQAALGPTASDSERTRITTLAEPFARYAELDTPSRTRLIRDTLAALSVETAGPARPAEPVAERKSEPSPPPRPVAPERAATQPTRARPPARAVPLANLSSSVVRLRGVESATAAKLARLGIETIGDVLNYTPRRHVDYSTLKTIDQLMFGEEVTVLGTITNVRNRETRRGFRITEVTIGDDTGALVAQWFNQHWLAARLHAGQQVAISGKVDEYLGKIVFSNPDWELVQRELLHTGRLVPMYRLTEGLFPRQFRTLMQSALSEYLPQIADPLPVGVRQRARLPDLASALKQMHFPDNLQSLERARRRLAFDEFFFIQLSVLRQRRLWQAVPTDPLACDDDTIGSFVAALPFPLTGTQQRAIAAVRQDLAQAVPMSRLLQGDVGSGKTVVAAAAARIALSQGKQCAVMAPTEILAEQHFRTFSRFFPNGSTKVRILTGSMPKKEKEAVKAEAIDGAAGIIIGTHALIQEDVAFRDLGLVVVDEQHRFGVEQRALLRQKGYNPHMLVMTATPIPRTLSLTLYGDLDVTTLDEMPPGRQPIVTRWRMPLERERTYAFIRSQVEQGRQAFIICPLVEESDKLEAKAATAEHERLQRDVFPSLRLGLLHGRMRGSEKDDIMRAFLAREYDVLVSTSVVEVGIDVPNATVMLVEGANRFGLSQLHQFRGRVGRGPYPSYCFLLADAQSEDAAKRLAIIEQTQDGFRLAEEDLKMRGPGEFFGTRQSGLPDLRVARLGDVQVLEDARREAQELYRGDPDLARPEHALLKERLNGFGRGGDLS